MRLSVKITLYIAVVLAFAVALIVFLNTAKFRSVFEDVQRSRMLVIGLDLKQTIERGFTLGLTLEQLSNMGDVVARVKRNNPDIQDLRIVDLTGTALYQAGGGETPLDLVQNLERLRHDDATGQVPTQRPIASDLALGLLVPVTNTFGRAAGAVTLAIDREPMEAATSAFARALTIRGLIALAIGTLLTALLTELYLRGITRRFVMMTRKVQTFMADDSVLESSPPLPTDDGDLENRLGRVQQRAREMSERLRSIEAGLRKR